MKYGPIFEWIPGNIILDKQVEKEYFYNLINDLQHHHNDDNGRNYVPESSDEDENILATWEAEYVAMDKKESMIVIYDDIYEEGDISDHEYSSDNSKE